MKNKTGKEVPVTIEVRSLEEAIVLEQALADYKMDQHHKARKAKGDEQNAKYEKAFSERSGIAQDMQSRLIDAVPDDWKGKPLAEHIPNGGPIMLKDWPGPRCGDCGWYADVENSKDDWTERGWCDKRGVEAHRFDPACEKSNKALEKEGGNGNG